MTPPIPWPGPLPYSDRQAKVFRGRRRELNRLLNLLQGQRLTLMTASSGAGKTSLIQAGLLPRLRQLRLEDWSEDQSCPPGAPFPVLMNQWLIRAEQDKQAPEFDFAHLLTLELHHQLITTRAWFDAEQSPRGIAIDSEVQAIECATNAVASIAEGAGFARRTADAEPESLEWVRPVRVASDRERTELLLELLDAAEAHLGPMLLILDQFEEILQDWRLGQQAQETVESLYRLRPTSVRQLVSMRDDGLHLLDELVTKNLIDQKRQFKVYPLSTESVRQIVEEVSTEYGHTWDSAFFSGDRTLLEELIVCFGHNATGAGVKRGEINLVGLQVVLNALFGEHLAENDPITADALTAYCSSLAPRAKTHHLTDWLGEKARHSLAEEAQRSWISRCLSARPPAEEDESAEVFELQIMPLAARMAWLLVTPSGNKRPMTEPELHGYAFREAAKDFSDGDFAGKAEEDGWDKPAYMRHMEATCNEALGRLVRGNVLKKRGSESGRITYELVHDQFGLPLQRWARDYEATPEFDLNSPHTLRSRLFKWSGPLRPHDDDGFIPYVHWSDCTLNNVDLSDLSFIECDFGESIFNRCTFDDVVFAHCDLSNVTFKGCSFDSVVFYDCTLKSTTWTSLEARAPDAPAADSRAGEGPSDTLTSLRSVAFFGQRDDGCLPNARFERVKLADCRFAADDGCAEPGSDTAGLSLERIQFLDCDFNGTVEFDRCDLATLILKGEEAPTRIRRELRFDQCSLRGSEISRLDVRGAVLGITDCDCSAAVFIMLDAGRDSRGEPAKLAFDNVSLVGTAMLGCTLDEVDFSGPGDDDTAAPRSRATAMTIRPFGEVASRLSNVRFRHLLADNWSIAGCDIAGSLTFDDCLLTGSEILGSTSSSTASASVGGSMKFLAGCDVSAARFESLRFTSEHPLVLERCIAKGTLFSDVEFAGESADRPAGRFDQSDLSGAVFRGATLRGVHFKGSVDQEGRPSSEMPALTFLPSLRDVSRASVLAHVQFENCHMPGFVIRDAGIHAALAFRNCTLVGGSISQKGVARENATIHGDLSFERCAMNSIELSHLVTDGSVFLVDDDCRGAFFNELTLKGGGGLTGLFVKRCPMSGASFVDCNISRATFAGADPVARTEALTLAFLGSPGQLAELGGATFEDYAVDGGTLQSLRLTGPVIFRRCSLLRTKYSALDLSNGGSLDLTESDLLYAEVDADLFEDVAHFAISEQQRAALESQRAHEAILQGSRAREE